MYHALMRRVSAIALVLLALCGVAARGQDWPQFRGPTGQGYAEARGVPLQWSETQNVKWKVPVNGRGWSSPVVAQGRVWLTTSVEMPAAGRERAGLSLRALAFDAETGKRLVDVEVFRFSDLRPLNEKNSFASPTPILDGDRVYVHFGADGTAALSTTGEILWKARYNYDSQHGGGGSPVLYNDLLDLQLRRQRRRGVRRGAGHAHRQGAVEAATGASPRRRRIRRRSSSP